MILATAFFAGMFFGGLTVSAVLFIMYLRNDDAQRWRQSVTLYYATSFVIAPIATICAILSVAMMIADDAVLFSIVTTLLRAVFG